jgi:hypothetical protein
MLVPYSPEDSLQFYEDYYVTQDGYGMSIPIFKGRIVMPGNGIGSLFSGLFRSAIPLLKRGALSAGKKLLTGGVDVLSDIAGGKSLKQSAKSRLKTAGGELLADVRDTILGRGNSYATPVHSGGKKRESGKSG